MAALIAFAIREAKNYHHSLLLENFAANYDLSAIATWGALGIKVVFVPCLCTWLLQPPDVFAFRRYTAALGAKVQDARASHPIGDLSKARWLSIVMEIIEESIVSRRWANELLYVGIANGLHHVSSYIQQQLGDIDSLLVSSRIEEVEKWLDSFRGESFRRELLVLDGPSQLGKTVFCEALVPGAPFHTNCDKANKPDLRNKRPVKHKGALFDEAAPQWLSPVGVSFRHVKRK